MVCVGELNDMSGIERMIGLVGPSPIDDLSAFQDYATIKRALCYAPEWPHTPRIALG